MSGGDRTLLSVLEWRRHGGGWITGPVERYVIPCEIPGICVVDNAWVPGTFNLVHIATGSHLLRIIPSLREAHDIATQIGEWADWTVTRSKSERTPLRERLNATFPRYANLGRREEWPIINRPEDSGRVLDNQGGATVSGK